MLPSNKVEIELFGESEASQLILPYLYLHKGKAIGIKMKVLNQELGYGNHQGQVKFESEFLMLRLMDSRASLADSSKGIEGRSRLKRL